MIGANHNWFNTVWIFDGDDAGGGSDQACAPSQATNTRLSGGPYTRDNRGSGDPALMGDQPKAGLALMGFGFVVARFGLFLHEVAAVRGGPAPEDHGSVWLGAFMVALGSAVNVLAAIRHVRLIRRLERGGTYRMDIWSLGVGVTLLLAALGAVMTAYLIIERPS